MSEVKNLQGLRGWLILVGIGVVLGPLRLMFGYAPVYYSLFTDGSFEILTTVGTDVYNPLWGPFLISELIFNLGMLLASVYLAFLFFTKHYLFPKVYIAIVAVSLIFIPLDAWFGSFVLVDEPMLDPDTAKELVRAVMNAVIWVPYMLLSKRVKATFVERAPENFSEVTTSEA